jgi:hypothetical protein
VSKRTALQKRRIADFARLCVNSLVRADDAVMHCDSSAADAHRALAAYWSGRAFGEVLA